MNIKYLDCDDKYKMFSFYDHDYKSKKIDDVWYMIDGGQESYIRKSQNGIIKEDSIENLIKDIREQFTWTSQLDVDGKKLNKPITKKLKDITTSHLNKLVVFCKDTPLLVEIFKQELKYRNEQEYSNN